MILLQILWLLAPAGVANMSAAISAKLLPNLNAPVDFGKTLRGKRILGDHKTFRGLILGTFFGSIIYLLQVYLFENYDFTDKLSLFDYSNESIFIGFLLSFGGLFGDMVKSFFKRQMSIASGKSWLIFDQIDWIVGSLLLSWPLTRIELSYIIIAIIFGFVLHLSIKYIGYNLGLDKEPF